MEFDRDTAGRRAFPPVREGYDRAAVDAYLQALAAEVETLTRASGALHDRVRALGAELHTLTLSLRPGAVEQPVVVERPAPPTLAPPAASSAPQAAERLAASSPPPASPLPSSPTPQAPASAPAEAVNGASEDLDGARLVALNMALGGEPREQADRYLAERFHLADRARLLDEVYAAVEG